MMAGAWDVMQGEMRWYVTWEGNNTGHHKVPVFENILKGWTVLLTHYIRLAMGPFPARCTLLITAADALKFPKPLWP